MKRGKPLARRTPLVAKTPLRSRSELRNRTPIASTAKRRKPGRADIPAAVRRAVYDRSGGVCAACGLAGANHVHHRKLRSQGGQHDLANLIHVHGTCHERIHARPQDSYLLGLLVRAADDPATVPAHGWRWAA